MSENTPAQNEEKPHNDSSWATSEITRILNHQLQEIREQRNQALRVLRVQFTVAGILVAALTAVLSTSITTELPVRIVGEGFSGVIAGPISVILGIFLLARGIIGFFRGSYSALNVLSGRPVNSIPYWKQVTKLVLLLVGKGVDYGPTRRAIIGPEAADLRDIIEDENPARLLGDQIDCIEKNRDIMEDNEENLFHLYRKMAWGLTTFGIGVVILTFTLPSLS
ncbi:MULTISPECIES: hypothetical protein [Halobacteriales]|uniref:hypothetical protein n=1 Tax=Halobacteriales TaxID=2235 RepID=UPI00109243E6|nr:MULTISPECIES: hypothetical protein [Halobacteriales]